jgi:hypothetical protein
MGHRSTAVDTFTGIVLLSHNAVRTSDSDPNRGSPSHGDRCLLWRMRVCACRSLTWQTRLAP